LPVTKITDPTRDRYHSLALSSVWELEVVRGARALVVGAGALGNEVGKNLAMMGVRSVVVADKDVVEVANLTRSVFFKESDHGAPKAETLAHRLRELNPDLRTLALDGDIEDTLGLGLVRRMDMIFSCLDNRLARRTVNRMCQKLAKPWVDGSMENLLGDVTVFLPDSGPCYECTLNSLDEEIMAKATACRGVALQNIKLGRVPTISTMGSIIAALQVQEGVKLLHGDLQLSPANQRLVVNCQINDFYTVRNERREACKGHFRFGDITEVMQWTSAGTTPREIIERYERDTGRPGHLSLGHEIILGVKCEVCGTTEMFERARRGLSVVEATCPACDELRFRVSKNVISTADENSVWTLERLGVPRLDVLEVRGGAGSRWYELTGDIEACSDSL
jgi:adenylyltransferase/sulfurtransferase